jgi:nucleoside-diphosphate-sugar epimerase
VLDKDMKRYLLLGGDGFIGRSLKKYLQDRGYEVDSLDIKTEPKHDLRQLRINELSRYSGCFFLAWNVGGSKYLGNLETWQAQYSDNVALMHNVFPQLGESEIPFLFVSSQLAGSDDSPYSTTKLLAEKYAQTFSNAVVARQWNVYGSVEKVDIKSHVISDLVIQAVSQKEIKLLTDGSEIRKFIHLDDVCDSYFTLINNHIGSVFDVSAGDYVSILEIAKLIARMTGATVIPGEVKGHNPNVKETLPIPDWKPTVDLETGIESLIQEAHKALLE